MSHRVLPTELSVSKNATTPVPADLKLRAKEALADAVERSRKLYGVNFPMPSISFDLRGVTAGYAISGSGRFHVQLNAQLYIENVDIFLTDTIIHEWAHLAARTLHRKKKIQSHGPEWQQVMRDLGVTPTRCHAMDTTNARVHKLFDYKCGCKTYQLTSIRHGYIQSGRSSYRCRTCRKPLLWAQDPRLTKEKASVLVAGDNVEAPSAESGSQVVPPSSAMRSRLLSLANLLLRPIPPNALKSQSVCASLILTWEHELHARQHQQKPTPASTVRAPASHTTPTAKPTAGPVFAPSERQLQFAKDLAKRHGVSIPSEALVSKSQMSAWITAMLERRA